MSAATADDALVGKNLGGNRIIKILGGGGMGVVYRAMQDRLRAPVAVKVIRAAFSYDAKLIARFEREAREIAKLRGRTPHVVQIYDFGRDQGSGLYFISMELVEGEGVDRILKRGGPLPDLVAARIIRQAARGLEVARQHGMVHRDIKPENMLLTRHGVVKLTDFGLAKGLAGDSVAVTQSGQILGTPAYMSPQQAEGTEVDHRSDLYSLGATFYTLLTAATPYKADTPVAMAIQHIRSPVPDPRTLGKGVSEGVSAVVKRMMAKEPDDRFQSGGEVVAALDALIKADPAEAGRADEAVLAALVEWEEPSELDVIDVSAETVPPATHGATPGTKVEPQGTMMEYTPATGVRTVAEPPPAPVAPTAMTGIRGGSRAWIPLAAVGLGGVGVVAVVIAMSGSGGTPAGGGGTGTPPTPPPAAAKLRLGTPDAPRRDAMLGKAQVHVEGRFVGEGAKPFVRVNGSYAKIERDLYSLDVTLAEGKGELKIEAGSGETVHDELSLPVTVDLTAPMVTLAQPVEALITREGRVEVKGTAGDPHLVAVKVQGATATLAADGAFSADALLPEGASDLVIEATDKAGHLTKLVRKVMRDVRPPELTLDAAPKSPHRLPQYLVSGRIADPSPVTVSVDGTPATLDAGGGLAHPVTLKAGWNTIPVVARDAAGNETSKALAIEYAPLPDGLAPAATGDRAVSTSDGAEMVACAAPAGPVYFDRTEVTVAQYAKFLAALGDAAAPRVPLEWDWQRASGRERLPVVGVSWHDAMAYATWAGKSLPTEAEWSAGAGGAARGWPWGEAPIAPGRAIFGREPGGDDGGPAAAGERPDGAAPGGAEDLAGNVAEWCADVLEDGAVRVVKGGSWADPAEECRPAARRLESPDEQAFTIGFRCVVRLPAGTRGNG